jgi:hypothetical protein
LYSFTGDLARQEARGLSGGEVVQQRSLLVQAGGHHRQQVGLGLVASRTPRAETAFAPQDGGAEHPLRGVVGRLPSRSVRNDHGAGQRASRARHIPAALALPNYCPVSSSSISHFRLAGPSCA